MSLLLLFSTVRGVAFNILVSMLIRAAPSVDVIVVVVLVDVVVVVVAVVVAVVVIDVVARVSGIGSLERVRVTRVTRINKPRKMEVVPRMFRSQTSKGLVFVVAE